MLTGIFLSYIFGYHFPSQAQLESILLAAFVCALVIAGCVCYRRRASYKVNGSTGMDHDDNYDHEDGWDHEGKYLSSSAHGSQILNTEKSHSCGNISRNISEPENTPTKLSRRSYEKTEVGYQDKLSARHSSHVGAPVFAGTMTSIRSTPDLGSTVGTENLDGGGVMDTTFNYPSHPISSFSKLMYPVPQQDMMTPSSHLFDVEDGGECGAGDYEKDHWESSDEDSVKGVGINTTYPLKSRSSGMLFIESEVNQWSHSKDLDMFRSRSTPDLGSTVGMENLDGGGVMDTAFNYSSHPISSFSKLMYPVPQQDMMSPSVHLFDIEGGGECGAGAYEKDHWESSDEDSVKGVGINTAYALKSRSSGMLFIESEVNQWSHSKDSDMFRSQTMDMAVEEMTSGPDEPVWHPTPYLPRRSQSSQGNHCHHHHNHRNIAYYKQRSSGMLFIESEVNQWSHSKVSDMFRSRSTPDLGSTVGMENLDGGGVMDTPFNYPSHPISSFSKLMYPVPQQDMMSPSGHLFDVEDGGECGTGDYEKDHWESSDEDSVKGVGINTTYPLKSHSSGMLFIESEVNQWSHSKDSDMFRSRSTPDLGSTVGMENLDGGGIMDTAFNYPSHPISSFSKLMYPVPQQDMMSPSVHLFDVEDRGECSAGDYKKDHWESSDEDSVKDVGINTAYPLKSRSSGMLLIESEVNQLASYKQRSADPRMVGNSLSMYQGADGYYQPPQVPYQHSIHGAISYQGIHKPHKASSIISEPYYNSRGYQQGRHSSQSNHSQSYHRQAPYKGGYYEHTYPYHYQPSNVYISYQGIHKPRKASRIISEPYYNRRGYWQGRHSSQSYHRQAPYKGVYYEHTYPYHYQPSDVYTQSTQADSLSQPSVSPADDFNLRPSYGPESLSHSASLSSLSIASTRSSGDENELPN